MPVHTFFASLRVHSRLLSISLFLQSEFGTITQLFASFRPEKPYPYRVTVLCENAEIHSRCPDLAGFGRMEKPVEGESLRILVVDDYEPWRRLLVSILSQQPGLLIVGEAGDGLCAVERASELQPDLILLDIGLPTMNGIEAARQIHRLAPRSKMLFISENRSKDIAEEALRTGALGYIVKSDAGSELWPGIKAVLQGQKFVSARLGGVSLTNSMAERTADDHSSNQALAPSTPEDVKAVGRHEVAFYRDDGALLDGIVDFVGTALKSGNSAVVVATGPHRDTLLQRLQAEDLDIHTAIEEGRYLALDAADTLSTFMVNDLPDPGRFMEAFGDLVVSVVKAAKATQPRVAIFGEGVNLLWTQGNVEAAIQIENLCNQLANLYDIDILCGYSLTYARADKHFFQRICAEHSAVYTG